MTAETANETPPKTNVRQRRDKEEEKFKGKDISSYENRKHPAADEVSEAVFFYNSIATESGWPKVQKLTKPRRSHLLTRLNEVGGLEGRRVAIEKANASDFLTGKTNCPFFANFDWLTKLSSFTKLMEGNYDNRNNSSRSANPNSKSNPILIAGRMRKSLQDNRH